MKFYRIADTRHTIWSGTGAMLAGGRFNSPGRPVIYAALTFAGAMLEVLVHARIGIMPKTHAWVDARRNVPRDSDCAQARSRTARSNAAGRARRRTRH